MLQLIIVDYPIVFPIDVGGWSKKMLPTNETNWFIPFAY
jgi:hypothetical protein